MEKGHGIKAFIFCLKDRLKYFTWKEANVTKVWTLAQIWNYHYFYIKPVFLLYCEQIKMNNIAFILIFVLSHTRNLSKIKMQQREKSRHFLIYFATDQIFVRFFIWFWGVESRPIYLDFCLPLIFFFLSNRLTQHQTGPIFPYIHGKSFILTPNEAVSASTFSEYLSSRIVFTK